MALPMLAIGKMLSLSTEHVTKQTMDTLEDVALWRVERRQYGAFLWVSEEPVALYADLRDRIAAAELIPLYELAQRYGCAWIDLDRDSAAVPGLPTFDWELSQDKPQP